MSGLMLMLSLLISVVLLAVLSIKFVEVSLRKKKIQSRLKKQCQKQNTDIVSQYQLAPKHSRILFKWPLSRVILWFSVLMGSFALISLLFESHALLTTVTSSYLLIASGILYIAGYIKQKQRNKFIDELPAIIEFIAQAVTGGRTVPEAITLVCEKYTGLIQKVFKRINRSINLGQSYVDAIRKEALELKMVEFYFFSIIIVTQFKTGGKIAELLGNLAKTLYEKRALKLKIKSLTSEAKTSMIILAILPWVAVLSTLLIAKDYLAPLFTHPIGRMVLGGSILSEVIAFMIYKRMSKGKL